MAAPAAIRPKTRTHFVPVPKSYFRLACELPASQYIILGLMIERTWGWPKKPQNKLDKEFRQLAARTANISPGQADIAIASLRERGLICITEEESGDKTFDVTLEILPEDTAVAVCSQCLSRGVIHLEKGFAPLPHDALTALPACLSYSELTVYQIVMSRTVRTAKDIRELPNGRVSVRLKFEATSCAIPNEDLLWGSDGDVGARSTLHAARASLERLGLMSSVGRGKTRTYQIRLGEMGELPRLPRRPTREVDLRHNAARRKVPAALAATELVPAGTEETEESDRQAEVVEEVVEDTGQEEVECPAETVRAGVYGRCTACGKFAPVRVIEMPAPTEKPVPPRARAGPTRPLDPKFDYLPDRSMDHSPTFMVFWGLFEAAGKALNFQDKMLAWAEWRKHDEATHEAIIRWVVNQMKNTWRTEVYTPQPVSALRYMGWTRIAQPRIIPDAQRPMSDRERWMADIERRRAEVTRERKAQFGDREEPWKS